MSLKQVKTPTRQSEVESSSENRRRDGRKTTPSKVVPEKKQIKKKIDRKTESSDRSRLKHITKVEKTDASPVSNLCDDQCRGEKFPAKAARKVSSIYIPVVSSTGKPLMPCHPARARQMLKKGKAIKRFTNSIFYIKLVDRDDGELQKVACGIDPGFMREGFTVKSEKRTFINILSETITIQKTGSNIISESLKHRNNRRHFRRYRKTPCRKCRCNLSSSKRNWVPPSIKARYEYKIRISKILLKIFPITDFVIEDICAETKESQRKWNLCFSPLEIGKKWFYNEMRKIGSVKIMKGHETSAIRENLCLIKTKEKLEDVFSAHNVDSWVLANSIFNSQTVPDNTKIYKFVAMIVHRRQLALFNPAKGGLRRRYGGTVSLGIRKFTVCRFNNKYVTVGGNCNGKIQLHDLKSNKRISSTKVKNLELFNYIQRWKVTVI